MPSIDQIQRHPKHPRPADEAGMTRWYVASLADGDTHLAEPVTGQHLVRAHCDRQRFRPLAALPGPPPDQAQVCPTCRSDQHRPTPGPPGPGAAVIAG